MNIKIITGQQGSDLLHYANKYDGTKVEFPEVNICHSYDLCENVMEITQEYYDRDIDLIIVTYSEIVLDSIRLWVARNKFSNAECINVLSDGNYINVPINENGEMDRWCI